MPKQHNGYFCHMPPEEIPALASILKDTLTKIKNIFASPAYNFIMHSSPVNGDTGPEYYHWHIEIMPKLTRVAGFEWGSGFYVVPTPPELAAKYLREK
jgi:UDPglucose--hexose-1-phosphate uridylyltransferase